MKNTALWRWLSVLCLAAASSALAQKSQTRGGMPTAPGYIAEFSDEVGSLTNSPFFEVDGNVGLGTTTPAATLDVNGTLNAGPIAGTSSDVNGVGVSGQADSGPLADGVLGQSASGNGVHGKSNSANASGVYGENNASSSGFGVAGYANAPNGTGVWGRSGGTNGVGVSGQADSGPLADGVLGQSATGNGVHGKSNSTGASGVYGESNASSGGYGVAGYSGASNGIGVWGKAPAGWSFSSDGNVHQERTGGGWVKAMISVNALFSPFRIERCFNSMVSGPAVTTPPCNIVFTEVESGTWRFDFGFRVDDRFYSATLTRVNEFDQANSIVANRGTPSPNFITVQTMDEHGNGKPARFDLIVF